MRVLQSTEVAAISGGAEPTAPRPVSPFITVPVALFTGLFTVLNVVISLPALLAYRS